MPIDHSERYRDRWSDITDPGYLKRLLPQDDIREIVTSCIATSILAANAIDPSRWGTTRYEGSIRLNAGAVEALIVGGSQVALVVDVNTVRDVRPDASAGGYKPVPTSAVVREDYHETRSLEERLELLWPAHLVHIQRAIAAGLNGALRKGHDPLLVEQIAEEAGADLPQPSFVGISKPNVVQVGGSEPEPASYREGAKVEVRMTRYERSSKARHDCIDEYGAKCIVCDFDFHEAYGPVGEGLIHVHHLEELSVSGERKTRPDSDLVPVCPNCHFIIHQRKPPYGVPEVRAFLRKRR